MPSSEELVSDASKAEDVVARVRTCAAQHLWAGIGRCTSWDARSILLLEPGCSAEVEYLDLPIRADEYIRRFEVSVHDIVAVRVGERLRTSSQHGAFQSGRQRYRLTHQRGERSSFDELHRHEPSPIVMS